MPLLLLSVSLRQNVSPLRPYKLECLYDLTRMPPWDYPSTRWQTCTAVIISHRPLPCPQPVWTMPPVPSLSALAAPLVPSQFSPPTPLPKWRSSPSGCRRSSPGRRCPQPMPTAPNQAGAIRIPHLFHTEDPLHAAREGETWIADLVQTDAVRSRCRQLPSKLAPSACRIWSIPRTLSMPPVQVRPGFPLSLSLSPPWIWKT